MLNPIIIYRWSHFFFKIGVPILPLIFQKINFFLNSCDIPPSAIIHPSVDFKHFGLGVVINNKCEINKNVVIMPHVVIGQHLSAIEKKDFKKITINEGALLGAGSKIIATGFLRIGKNVSIGANAVVLNSIEDGDIVVGVPAKSKKY